MKTGYRITNPETIAALRQHVPTLIEAVKLQPGKIRLWDAALQAWECRRRPWWLRWRGLFSVPARVPRFDRGRK